MSRDELIRLIAEYIIQEAGGGPGEELPAPDLRIIECGLLDSLGLFKLIEFLEQRLGVKIAPEEIVLDNFATIGAIATLVQARAR